MSVKVSCIIVAMLLCHLEVSTGWYGSVRHGSMQCLPFQLQNLGTSPKTSYLYHSTFSSFYLCTQRNIQKVWIYVLDHTSFLAYKPVGVHLLFSLWWRNAYMKISSRKHSAAVHDRALMECTYGIDNWCINVDNHIIFSIIFDNDLDTVFLIMAVLTFKSGDSKALASPSGPPNK